MRDGECLSCHLNSNLPLLHSFLKSVNHTQVSHKEPPDAKASRLGLASYLAVILPDTREEAPLADSSHSFERCSQDLLFYGCRGLELAAFYRSSSLANV